jgi:hypothetical protein
MEAPNRTHQFRLVTLGDANELDKVIVKVL